MSVSPRASDRLKARGRFQLHKRIDAELPEFPDGFAGVSDIEQFPLNVVYSAVRDGLLIVGDETVADDYRKQVEREYGEATDE